MQTEEPQLPRAEQEEPLQGSMARGDKITPVELPTLKSLMIEIFRGEMRLGTATGILLARDQSSHCALITNRHVVTGRHQDTDQALHSKGALPDHIVIHFHVDAGEHWAWKPIRLPLYRQSGKPFWIEHPRLGAQADTVALNLRWGNDTWRLPYYLDTAHDRSGLLVRPAEPISVIGFPFGLSSAQTFPIWATGFLAQELSFVSEERPTFLIDCRTRAGQSGSAVVAFRTGNHVVSDGTRVSAKLTPNVAWEFLGVYSGRVNADSDLGRVWHVSVLGELLDAAAADFNGRAA